MRREFDRFDAMEVAEGFDRPYFSPLYRRLNWRYGRPVCHCGRHGCRCGTRHGGRFW